MLAKVSLRTKSNIFVVSLVRDSEIRILGHKHTALCACVACASRGKTEQWSHRKSYCNAFKLVIIIRRFTLFTQQFKTQMHCVQYATYNSQRVH